MESKIFVPDEGNYFKIHIMTLPFSFGGGH